jgi:hypothetical protein
VVSGPKTKKHPPPTRKRAKRQVLTIPIQIREHPACDHAAISVETSEPNDHRGLSQVEHHNYTPAPLECKTRAMRAAQLPPRPVKPRACVCTSALVKSKDPKGRFQRKPFGSEQI